MGLDRRHGRHHFFALLAAALAIARSLKTFRTSAVAAAWLFVAGVGEAEGAFGVTPGDNDAIGEEMLVPVKATLGLEMAMKQEREAKLAASVAIELCLDC